MNLIFQDAFRRHDAYKTALKYAFEDMMHTRGNRLAELMAKYIDGKLRTKGSMEEEVHVRAKPDPFKPNVFPLPPTPASARPLRWSWLSTT